MYRTNVQISALVARPDESVRTGVVLFNDNNTIEQKI